MDTKTTLEELKQAFADFSKERDWDQFHNPKDLAIGIITEAAELLEHFRFKNAKEIESLLNGPKREEIEDELADILIFVLEFARMNDIDLATAFHRKNEKNHKKYPVEKSRGNKKKYTEL